MGIIKADRKYVKSFHLQSQRMLAAYNTMMESSNVDLNGTEMSKSILLRMKAFHMAQLEIKEMFNIKMQQPGAHVFSQSVQFYFRLINEKLSLDFDVSGGEFYGYKGTKRGLRPDVSIKKEGRVVSIVECKTQLGWSRLGWKADLIKREDRLKHMFPNAKIFFIALTEGNWQGFQGLDGAGEKYFALLNCWPTSFKLQQFEKQSVDRFENVAKRVFNVN